MPGLPQARMLVDLHACNAPSIPPPPVLPVPLPIAPPCCPTVLIGAGKMPAARLGDSCACGGVIMAGEATVLVGG